MIESKRYVLRLASVIPRLNTSPDNAGEKSLTADGVDEASIYWSGATSRSKVDWLERDPRSLQRFQNLANPKRNPEP